MESHDERPCAFLTCATRAVTAVAPLLAAAETLFLDRGWRTRVPLRAPQRGGAKLDERRRLRFASYAEVERAQVVVHVPAPAHLSGARLHRELEHAIAMTVPILLLVALNDRERFGVAAPDPARVLQLQQLTRGGIVTSLDELIPLAEARPPARRAEG